MLDSMPDRATSARFSLIFLRKISFRRHIGDNNFACVKGRVQHHRCRKPRHLKQLRPPLNVDAITAKIDIWADISSRLPFRNGSVDAFYSSHVIEHLPGQALPFHFAEMFRCLRNGRVIRVGGPHGDSAVRKFQENDAAWFSDSPDKRRSIGTSS